ncbi:MAG: molybdopterin-dependent oxidoreductase [Planctomycetia bacterium]|nr:molybdopterin-dependent oxidoreductase [Planctomycetia bacterium]
MLGRYGFEFYSSKDRLKTPLVRDNINEPFREASWEEAIGLVAKRFSEIKKSTAPDSFRCLSSSRVQTRKTFLPEIYTCGNRHQHMDNCARVCHAPSVTGLRAARLGAERQQTHWPILKALKVLIVSGSNTTEAHPVAALKIKRR